MERDKGEGESRGWVERRMGFITIILWCKVTLLLVTIKVQHADAYIWTVECHLKMETLTVVQQNTKDRKQSATKG